MGNGHNIGTNSETCSSREQGVIQYIKPTHLQVKVSHHKICYEIFALKFTTANITMLQWTSVARHLVKIKSAVWC